MKNDYGQAGRIEKARIDFIQLVKPLLVFNGWNYQEVESMFHARQIRIRWGVDYKEFTMMQTAPVGCPNGDIDERIHDLWGGKYWPDVPVMTCFINEIGTKSVSSLAVTSLYLLSETFKQIRTGKIFTNMYGQTFTTLPFTHPSLGAKGFNIK